MKWGDALKEVANFFPPKSCGIYQTDVLLSYHPIYVGNLSSLVFQFPIKTSLFIISPHITTY